MSKTCGSCKEDKPLDAFYPKKYKSGKYGLNSYCKACMAVRSAKWSKENKEKVTAYKQEWRDANPERAISAQLKHRYGINYEKRQEMLEAQLHRCAICGRHEDTVERRGRQKVGFHVDHDHVTGKVRELLCYPCNTLIGLCRENIDVLASAIEYLGKHND